MTSQLESSLVDQLLRNDIPVVTLDGVKASKARSNIRVDYSAGAKEAVLYLKQLGHQRIAFITGPQNRLSARTYKQAFITALHEDGMPPAHCTEGDHTIEGGRRPAAALGRGDRRGRRLPHAGGQRQRQHPRPRRPAGQLRAGQPPGDPDRARRVDHGAGRPVRGQAAEQPERRDGEVGRVDLVLRPGLRDHQRLRGSSRRERDRRLQRLPDRPGPGEVRLVAEGLSGPNGLVFTPDEQRLLVSDSRANADQGLRRTRRRHAR